MAARADLQLRALLRVSRRSQFLRVPESWLTIFIVGTLGICRKFVDSTILWTVVVVSAATI
jgi:hypothetical protein